MLARSDGKMHGDIVFALCVQKLSPVHFLIGFIAYGMRMLSFPLLRCRRRHMHGLTRMAFDFTMFPQLVGYRLNQLDPSRLIYPGNKMLGSFDR